MTETIGTAGEAQTSSTLDGTGAPAHDLLFQPARGWVGDVIPVERDGEFHLFYLHELRDDPKPGTAWSLVTTRDFVHFEDRGVSLPHGGTDEDDFNAYTGSVVHDDGVDHLFYTGHNPWRMGPDGVTPLQVVMHATSVDGMRTWVKQPEDTFGATEGFEPGDWRDPFVFRPEPEGEWRMLLAARHVDGPSRRRGTIAQLVSSDLRSWRPVAPFWDPRRYIAHECPDVFQWGAHWYLVSSEFSEDFTTRYRIADSVDGPWRVPLHDSVDGRAFYASKSVERDGRRFFAGWIASKEDSRDDGAYQWAGTMSVLEALQRDDGTLGFTLPEEVLAAFDEELPVVLHDESGAVDSRDEIRLAVPDGYAARLGAFDLPSVFSASVRFDIAEGTTECGILLRSSADGDESYILRLEPTRNRMVLDRWPRRLTGPMQWQISGDVPFAVELERPADLSPGEHRLDLIVDGSALVAVLDRSVALSARIYDRPTGRIGLFAGEGEVVFRDLRLRRRTT